MVVHTEEDEKMTISMVKESTPARTASMLMEFEQMGN